MEVDPGMTQTVDNRKHKSSNASESNLVFPTNSPKAPANLNGESNLTSRGRSPAATPLQKNRLARNKSENRAKTPGAAALTTIPQ